MRLYENQPGGTVRRACDLRRDASSPERRLLRALREGLPPLKWRHQTPIGPYFADVMCFSERLVIEVDGDTHEESKAHDARRSAFIKQEGFRVVRVGNTDVMQNVDGVVMQISFSLREKEGARAAWPRGEDEGAGHGKGEAA